jgi:cytochrome c553
MTATSRLICLLIAATCALPAWSKGSAEAGATKAATCLACHGANGNSTNNLWPSLAGQNAAYVTLQLRHFHDKRRTGKADDATAQLMPPMAAPLSEQDIQDLAAYYSVQTPTGGEANAQYWQAGQQLYHGGDKSRGIPACAACHGPLGSGNPAAGYPQLRAQHADYVAHELNAYRERTRYTTDAKGTPAGGDNALIMQTIADRLTADDIRNLAAYVEGMR